LNDANLDASIISSASNPFFITQRGLSKGCPLKLKGKPTGKGMTGWEENQIPILTVMRFGDPYPWQSDHANEPLVLSRNMDVIIDLESEVLVKIHILLILGE
jgi:hypothetical protein